MASEKNWPTAKRFSFFGLSLRSSNLKKNSPYFFAILSNGL
jgi:hypothetical protein